MTPSFERLRTLIRSFGGRRVAVLGDLVCDEFVHGEISRVSREAPVLILEHRKTLLVPGGAGNATANLRALDAEPLPVGVIGGDDAGRRLQGVFRELGISTRGIVVEPSYSTPTKSRILAGGVHTRRQQVVRLDRGASHGDLPARTASALKLRLLAALRRADGLLIADYGYGAATPRMVSPALREARRLPVMVDSRSRVGRYRGVTACTPNQEELERALDVGPLGTDRSVSTAGNDLLRRSGDKAVLVTRGARGMSLFERGRPPRHIPAFGAGEVADVTGAGDTVVATFTLALLAGASFHEAAILANYAAGLVVMKYGTATVTRRELTEAIREDRAR